jgi:hypothetical protein
MVDLIRAGTIRKQGVVSVKAKALQLFENLFLNSMSFFSSGE